MGGAGTGNPNYDREVGDESWKPGGHTPSRELRTLGEEPRELRERADAIARRLVAEMGCEMRPRFGGRG